MNEPRRKAGRKRVQIDLTELEKLCSLHCTDEDLADWFGVSTRVNVNTIPHTTIKGVIAEKIEGMAWGPDLPNGHHMLYVTSDNDLNIGFPTQIYAFEVDPSPTGANINLVRQNTPEPLFPP